MIRHEDYVKLVEQQEQKEEERMQYLKENIAALKVFDVWSCDNESMYSPQCRKDLIYTADEIESESGMILEAMCDAGELYILVPAE